MSVLTGNSENLSANHQRGKKNRFVLSRGALFMSAISLKVFLEVNLDASCLD